MVIPPMVKRTKMCLKREPSARSSGSLSLHAFEFHSLKQQRGNVEVGDVETIKMPETFISENINYSVIA